MTKAKSATRSITPDSRAIRYSRAEQQLIKLLRASRKPLTTNHLVDWHWQDGHGGGSPPFNARIILGGLLRSIARKAEYNGEPWRLKNNGRQGPHPVEWRIERA